MDHFLSILIQSWLLLIYFMAAVDSFLLLCEEIEKCEQNVNCEGKMKEFKSVKKMQSRRENCEENVECEEKQ